MWFNYKLSIAIHENETFCKQFFIFDNLQQNIIILSQNEYITYHIFILYIYENSHSKGYYILRLYKNMPIIFFIFYVHNLVSLFNTNIF